VFRGAAPARQTAPRYLGAVAGAFLLNQAMLAASLSWFGRGALPDTLSQAMAMAAYSASLFLACRFWVCRPAVQARR
jgi:hypothetical protein